jgi:hypothetical protein
MAALIQGGGVTAGAYTNGNTAELIPASQHRRVKSELVNQRRFDSYP